MAAQQKTRAHYINSSFNIAWTIPTEAIKLLQQLLFSADMVKIKNSSRDFARSICFGERLSHQQSPLQAACHCSGDLPKRRSGRFQLFIMIIFIMISWWLSTLKIEQAWIPECPGHLYPYKWLGDDRLWKFPITDHSVSGIHVHESYRMTALLSNDYINTIYYLFYQFWFHSYNPIKEKFTHAFCRKS